MNPELSQRTGFLVLSEDTLNGRGLVTTTENGIRVVEHGERSKRFAWNPKGGPDLVQGLTVRGWVSGAWTTVGEPTYTTDETAAEVDHFAAKILAVPRSERWLEALSTALVGSWCAPLLQTGHLPLTALGDGLAPAERTVVFAYAEGKGTTWTEAATYASAEEPEAFGERVRRKAKRLAAEQRRRAEQRRPGLPAA